MPAESENSLAMWTNSKKPTSVQDACVFIAQRNDCTILHLIGNLTMEIIHQIKQTETSARFK